MMKGPRDNNKENKQLSENLTLKIWGKGPVRFLDVELDCYILQDGTAILNKTKMMQVLGRKWRGKSRSESPTFIGAQNLQPFIKPELKEKLKGTEFYDGPRLVSGYEADILPLVCDVYLDARTAGALTVSQLPIAQTCEMLVRAFARVGVVALIYEQLGFERYKHPEALRLLIESYLTEDARKWAKEFPDELFFQMDRIYGNVRTTSRNRPQYYAKFLRKYIYEPIEKGMVLNRLDEVNPVNEKGNRSHRHHSHMTTEIGLPALQAQIWQVVGALKISANKRKFEEAFARMMGAAWTPNMFEDV